MKFTFVLLGLAVCATAAAPGFAQGVSVSRENRVISVSATATVRVDPELAEVHFGVRAYGPTKESAYQESLRLATQVLDALMKSGISRERIATESLTLDTVSSDEVAPENRKNQRFEAVQKWVVRVPVGAAAKLVDLVVQSGANILGEVVWAITNPEALEGQANRTALERATKLAQQMASQLGLKLGDLLYVSNHASASEALGGVFPGDFQFITKSGTTTPLKTVLFPEQVERTAVTYATFAIQ